MTDTDNMYRGYQVLPDGTFSYFKIAARAQGDIPAFLHGRYTTRDLAKRQVDIYLSGLKKGKKNGKTKSPIGGKNP